VSKNQKRSKFTKVESNGPDKSQPSPEARPTPQEEPPPPPPPPEPPTLRIRAADDPPPQRNLGQIGLLLVQGRRRRAAFLAALSQVHDLSSGVAVEAPAEPVGGGSGSLYLTLTPPAGSDPTRFFELIRGALTAARLGPARARLSTGDGRVFVPYRDPAAPHGYDVQGDIPAQGRVLLTPDGAHPLPERQEMPLITALLEVPLLPEYYPEPPITLAVLTERRLAPLIAHYVQRHGMAYGVRFIDWQHDGHTRHAALFDIVTAGAVQPIPRFVRDFLARLPRTVLLTDALERGDLEHEPPQRVLVAHGWRTPLLLTNIHSLLPASGLLILGQSPWGAALIANPPPRQMIQSLTQIEINAPGRAELGAPAAGQLELRLSLERDGITNRPIHGLLLDAQALARLRRMVRHLPRPLFERMQIALGDGVAVLVASDERGYIEGLPLGQPLTRREPPDLLLPRGMSLYPSLPIDLLVPAIGMQPDTLTVLTRTQRYDIPVDALQPLGSLLFIDQPVQPLDITITPLDLPPLDLSDLLDEPPPPVPAQSEPAPPPPAPAPKSGGFAGSASFEEELRQRADQLQQAGDYLSAAIFYRHLRDAKNASACLERMRKRSAS
jgi:hypothetical protein